MVQSIRRRQLLVLALVGAIAIVWLFALPTPGAALPDYAAKTGQACGVCHVNPAGGGALTTLGQAFAAQADHTTDPAAAFARVSAPAATPTTAPAATATTAPAATATTAPAATATTAPAATATTAPAATATRAPAATATAPAGALPRTGGAPLPLLPVAVFGVIAVAVGLYSLRRWAQ